MTPASLQLKEKPSLTLLVNAGIYLLEPSACDYIPGGRRFDMTDLIRRLLEEGQMVAELPDHRVLAGRRPARGLPPGAGGPARWQDI